MEPLQNLLNMVTGAELSASQFSVVTSLRTRFLNAMIALGLSPTVPASTGGITLFNNFNGSLSSGVTAFFRLGSNAADTTYANVAHTARIAFSVRNLHAILQTPNHAGGSLAITFQVNNLDTALTFSVAASGGAGFYGNFSNTIAITVGQTFSIKMANPAGASSAIITSFWVEAFHP